MFKKVHLRLTLLCAGITAVIMLVMSLCYLYVSEKGLYRNQFQAFQNDINTISTNLEQQNVISMEWLSKMEAQGNYRFFVLDNGVPFLFNQLNDPADSGSSRLLLESRDSRNKLSEQNATVTVSDGINGTLTHYEYEFSSPSTETRYFCSVIQLGTGSSVLEVVVLSSLQRLELQMQEQRVRFLLIDIAATILLGVFAWFFTGILLKPIAENQQKQALFVAAASTSCARPYLSSCRRRNAAVTRPRSGRRVLSGPFIRRGCASLLSSRTCLPSPSRTATASLSEKNPRSWTRY